VRQRDPVRGEGEGESGGGFGEELARWRLPVGMAVSSNSDGGTRPQTAGGDEALGHGGEAGDGFDGNGARRSDRRCQPRTRERPNMPLWRGHGAWPCRPSQATRRGAWHARWRQCSDEQAQRGNGDRQVGSCSRFNSEIKTLLNEYSLKIARSWEKIQENSWR
jgi:hypothetical protein